MALLRRPPSGLLAGLWELPNLTPQLTAAEAMHQADEWGCAPLAVGEPIDRIHIFTHVEWRMRAYPIDCAATMPPFVWATEEELKSVYALPSAFRLFV